MVRVDLEAARGAGGSFTRKDALGRIDERSHMRYNATMIRTFRHTGLEAFFLKGSKGGIQPHHASRLRVMLTALNTAEGPDDMAAPGWRLHPLLDDLTGHFSVWVNGNWRLTFTFEGTDAILVDYQDYH